MYEFHKVKYKSILNIPSLHIPQQESVCILGKSGSGKSTLLKLLNKMISPAEGDILYHGQSLSQYPSVALRRKVVMLGQQPILFGQSIRDNLLAGLAFSDRTMPDDSYLLTILEQVSLNIHLEKNAYLLSGGEQQRLSLARILLMDPDVFLLDEPSSALDNATETALIGMMTAYTKQHQRSLIMVTHSQKLAEQFSTHVIHMVDGTISSSH